jgi:hypothetical protein
LVTRSRATKSVVTAEQQVTFKLLGSRDVDGISGLESELFQRGAARPGGRRQCQDAFFIWKQQPHSPPSRSIRNRCNLNSRHFR